MTPQEASKELKEEFEIFKDGIDPTAWENPNEELRKIIEANTIAIKILEQDPGEDCVSRKAALDLIVANHTELNGVNVVMYSPLCKDIKQLPPVTPQPKTGKWIDYSDEGYVECPFCGHATNCEDNIDELHYCFYCGAKMGSEE